MLLAADVEPPPTMPDDELAPKVQRVLVSLRKRDLEKAEERLEEFKGKTFTECGYGRVLALRGLVKTLRKANGVPLDTAKLQRSLGSFAKSPWTDDFDQGYLEVLSAFLAD
jgi:hypothetical protein